jgi:DNA invertase Pin-like site-specific DNA recombinase
MRHDNAAELPMLNGPAVLVDNFDQHVAMSNVEVSPTNDNPRWLSAQRLLDKVAKEIKQAVAYLRTSSAANVGTDKDSEKRQRKAIADYAKAAGYAIVEEFYDAAVSGADPVHTRPGFAAMLKRIEGNGVRVILVETANRFARDIMVQETGWQFLKERGVDLIAADSPSALIDDTPTSKMIRQLLGVISEFEKASLVAKLAGARRRKRTATGMKVEGRKSHAEERPEVVALVKALRRRKPKGGQMSLRAISAELEAQGHVNERGKPFNPNSIAAMLAQRSAPP